ncbi:MAG: PKD domain-containing protein [bacterium]
MLDKYYIKMIKKIIALILFSIIIIWATTLYSQENWVWSDPIDILSYVNTPDFDIDRNNSHLHIVSMKVFGGGVRYTEVDSLGNIIIEAFPVDNKDLGGIYYGASIAVDQDGYPHICYRKHLVEPWYYHLYYTYKTDSGWSNHKLIAANVKRGYLVRMDIDGENRVHIIHSSLSDSSYGKVTYYQIRDGNVMGQLTKTITDPLNSEDVLFKLDNRFELEASYDGDIHVVLGCPFPEYGKITYFYSHDAGESFTKWGHLHSTDCKRRKGDPDVFLDQVGNIHFSYGTNHDRSLDNEPSVRYLRMSDDDIQEHNVVNTKGSIEKSGDDPFWGLGSVAASDKGKYVVATYLSKSGGKLWARISEDGGETWGTRKMLSESCGGYEGRNKHLIRACRNHFYVVYPENNPTKLRMRMIHFGDYHPVASAGGPYSGKEGESIELDMSASSDSGWYAGISEYAWDWDQDGEYDFKTKLSKTTYTFDDDFSGNAVLRVTDNSGKFDFDTAYFTVTNVPPIVDAGSDIVCEEGDTLHFSAVVEDPGDDVISFVWDFDDGNYSDEPKPTHIYIDDSTYNVTVRVDDGDGGVSEDEIVCHVNNCDPIADAGGPYVGVIKSDILLKAEVYDKGAGDSIIYKRWDLDNDNIFETSGYEAVVNYEQAGTYIVWFKAGDDDGGVGSDSAVVLVSCEAPYISSIPNQSIDEGGTFQEVELDNYVYDQDHTVDQLEWSFKGNEVLDVSINERILFVCVPDSNWWGEEKITLMVRDPVDNKDSCEVLFTVHPVNDPPRWISIDKFSFTEDDSLIIGYQEFYDHVEDIDDELEDLRFDIEGNVNIQWYTDYNREIFCLFAPPDWYGTEELTFIVIDTSDARDQIQNTVSVYDDKSDPPLPFDLIQPLSYSFKHWPDTIKFIWHSTTDPDSESYVFYKWELRSQGGGVVVDNKTFLNEEDTVFYHQPDTTLPAGTYLWNVTAYDEQNYSFKAYPPGSLILERPTAVEKNRASVPNDFRLLENYPNPFNPETKIKYELPVAGNVTIKIYNMMGQQVRTLVNGFEEAGYHQVIWDGCNDKANKVPSGMYIYIMQCGSHVRMQKALLMK